MTVRHVVAWTLASADPTERAAGAAEIRNRLLALNGVVPSLRNIQVGIESIAEAARTATVIADFDDAEGLHAYVVHPVHQEVAAFINSITSNRIAVDWEA